jgi:hypothetical protein
MSEVELNTYCAIAAIALGCDWNDFEVIYVSDHSILVERDGARQAVLVEGKSE